VLVLATRSPPGSSCCQADSYDQFVRLFTPLSPEKQANWSAACL
jgi:hypothetical protein